VSERNPPRCILERRRAESVVAVSETATIRRKKVVEREKGRTRKGRRLVESL